MIKKLLNKIFYIFSSEYNRNQIESYLAQSANLYDLENRQKELIKKGVYNRFYTSIFILWNHS